MISLQSIPDNMDRSPDPLCPRLGKVKDNRCPGRRAKARNGDDVTWLCFSKLSIYLDVLSWDFADCSSLKKTQGKDFYIQHRPTSHRGVLSSILMGADHGSHGPS